MILAYDNVIPIISKKVWDLLSLLPICSWPLWDMESCVGCSGSMDSSLISYLDA